MIYAWMNFNIFVDDKSIDELLLKVVKLNKVSSFMRRMLREREKEI